MEDIERINIKRIEVIKTRFDSNLLYQEHLGRYNFAKNFVENKIVLDLGCNIGDGTLDLSLKAKRIIGIDSDINMLKIAFDNFRSDNVDYLAMDGCHLAFKDKIFDIVVSLEVIEHLENQDMFLSEISRVLKDEALAIISTPNREIIKIEGSTSNPMHVRELTFREFKAMLNKYFSRVKLYGQKRGKGVKGEAGRLHYFIRAVDIFGLRRLFPQKLKKKVYTNIAKVTGAKEDKDIIIKDLEISHRKIDLARNIIAVCQK